MAKSRVQSRCLVVDASVARAAGSLDSQHPVGLACREALMALRKVCHRIAWTEAIRDEWQRHQSQFSRQWLVSMVKLRKIVQPTLDLSLTNIIPGSTDLNIVKIIEKDWHLVLAALATDRRIMSTDSAVRYHLSTLSITDAQLKQLLWVDPVVSSSEVIRWLEDGAPDGRRWRLLDSQIN